MEIRLEIKNQCSICMKWRKVSSFFGTCGDKYRQSQDTCIEYEPLNRKRLFHFLNQKLKHSITEIK